MADKGVRCPGCGEALEPVEAECDDGMSYWYECRLHDGGCGWMSAMRSDEEAARDAAAKGVGEFD